MQQQKRRKIDRLPDGGPDQQLKTVNLPLSPLVTEKFFFR